MSINKSNNQSSEFDCFFISYRESNCEQNWLRTLELCPLAIRIHGVHGIDRAQLTCEHLSTTDYYWTIDGDNYLLEKLSFIPELDLHMFRCKDPVFNDTTPLGGIKLWRKNAIIHHDMSKGDFCLNATANKKVEDIYFSESRYNNSYYDAWKTAFRHCVKLLSPILKGRPHANNIDFYLQRWASAKNLTSKNSQWCFRGYIDAQQFVKTSIDIDYLNQINDYIFLIEYFNERYHSVTTNTQSI